MESKNSVIKHQKSSIAKNSTKEQPKSSIAKNSTKEQPKSIIAKKVPFEYNHHIPFLDRPLSAIISILRFMQVTREEELDKETGMYFTPKADHPFDPLSQQQIEVFGHTFSKESNADTLYKITPIYISKPYIAPKINYQAVEEPQTYSSPIGPLPFLRNTVPQSPDPIFVDFLNKI
jgi:hypothetical protein